MPKRIMDALGFGIPLLVAECLGWGYAGNEGGGEDQRQIDDDYHTNVQQQDGGNGKFNGNKIDVVRLRIEAQEVPAVLHHQQPDHKRIANEHA